MFPLLILSTRELASTNHYSPVWSHRLFPNPDHSERIYCDSVAFSVHRQQICTTAVQLVLKNREVEIRNNNHSVLFNHSTPEGGGGGGSHLLVRLGTQTSTLAAAVLPSPS